MAFQWISYISDFQIHSVCDLESMQSSTTMILSNFYDFNTCQISKANLQPVLGKNVSHVSPSSPDHYSSGRVSQKRADWLATALLSPYFWPAQYITVFGFSGGV